MWLTVLIITHHKETPAGRVAVAGTVIVALRLLCPCQHSRILSHAEALALVLNRTVGESRILAGIHTPVVSEQKITMY